MVSANQTPNEPFLGWAGDLEPSWSLLQWIVRVFHFVQRAYEKATLGKAEIVFLLLLSAQTVDLSV